MPITPPPTRIPEDTDLSVMAVRVFEMPLALWRVMLGLMYFASKTQYWEASTATATPEQCARAVSKALVEYEMFTIPAGTILPLMSETVPNGFLACDGAEYDTADYPRLVEILPASFIISATRFTVPDLRNRFLSGTGNLATLGAVGGENSKSLDASNLPPHEHTYSSPISGAIAYGEIPSIGITGMFTTTTGAAGSGAPFDNRPEFMFANFIIRAR